MDYEIFNVTFTITVYLHVIICQNDFKHDWDVKLNNLKCFQKKKL